MQIAVIGSGSWATALTKMLLDNGHHVNWWVRQENVIHHITKRRRNPNYLSSAELKIGKLDMSQSLEHTIRSSDILIIVIPSAYLLESFEGLDANIFKGKKIVSAIKGILPNNKHQLLNEYLAEHFGFDDKDYLTIMGPCHAEEVAAEKLSYLTFSGQDLEFTTQFAALFKTWYLNPVVGSDIWGTQYSAVMKNVYAIGAGIAHGLEYGDNFLSVYTANAAEEMAVFLRAVTAAKHLPTDGVNYANSVYLGDLLVTCYSLYSRNRTFGNMIGKGYSVKVAQLEMNMVAEGYYGCMGVHFVNQETVKAPLPIAETIYKILWEQMPADEGFLFIEQQLK